MSHHCPPNQTVERHESLSLKKGGDSGSLYESARQLLNALGRTLEPRDTSGHRLPVVSQSHRRAIASWLASQPAVDRTNA